MSYIPIGAEFITRIDELCTCGEKKSGLCVRSYLVQAVTEKFCATCEAEKMDSAFKRLEAMVRNGTHEWLNIDSIKGVSPLRVPDVSKFKPSYKGMKARI